MLFQVGGNILEAIECGNRFYFNINNVVVVPYWDDEDICYVNVGGSQFRVSFFYEWRSKKEIRKEADK